MRDPDPLTVPCGNCRAHTGAPCIGERGRPVKPHWERVTWASWITAERARGLVEVSK